MNISRISKEYLRNNYGIPEEFSQSDRKSPQRHPMETQMDTKALQNDQRHLKVVKSTRKDTQQSPKGPKGMPKGAQSLPKVVQKPPKKHPKDT